MHHKALTKVLKGHRRQRGSYNSTFYLLECEEVTTKEN